MNTQFQLSPASFEQWAWPVPIEYPTAVPGGTLMLPSGATGLVLFAHADADAHQQPCSRQLVRTLTANGLAVLQVEPPAQSAGVGEYEHSEDDCGRTAEWLTDVIRQRMDEIAYTRLHCKKELETLPGDTLVNADREERIAVLTTAWFQRCLKPRTAPAPPSHQVMN